MITLKNDELRFSFPQITEALERMLAERMRVNLAAILTEDRGQALLQLEQTRRYRHATDEQRARARQRVFSATPEKIREIFDRACRGWTTNSRAILSVGFQRTLRIPDDGKIYPLPAGLGRFPLRDIDDFESAVPAAWFERGGVLMPMYQSEALWIHFYASYPFALKVAAGKINAITGARWSEGLATGPQNYVVLPEQPWLDGFAVRRGVIRQFVAMPLGAGYSAEEQVTGMAENGGLQLQLHPMQPERYFERKIAARLPKSLGDLIDELVEDVLPFPETHHLARFAPVLCESAAMGLGAGGMMRQEIFADPNDFEDWDRTVSHRCFVHLCNSLVWRQITGENPPHPPFTAREYKTHGIPWFDYYRDDLAALEGFSILGWLKSVASLGKAKGAQPLTENETIQPDLIVQHGNARRPDEIREWVA